MIFKKCYLFHFSFCCLISLSALFTLIFITFGCKESNKHKKINSLGKEVVLRVEPSPNNPRNSEGDFITLKDGRILFVYSHFTGDKGHDDTSAQLASRYSIDKGKTWSQQGEVIVENEGKMNVMSVSLLRLQNNDIALFYLVKNSLADCIPYMRISTDEAKTWSDPIPCITDRKEYFVLNNNRVVQLKNGRLLMPVSLHISPGGIWGPKSGRGTIYSYFSDDSGSTWKPSLDVPNPDSVVLQEPGLIELKNGNIMMFMRTYSGVQYSSFSKDHGESWSTVEPSIIESPASPASIARIPSTGDLLLVWNNNGKDQLRTPLNIAISKDEGKSWSHIKKIEKNPNGWYCYTAIHFTDKEVLLGHGAGYRNEETGRSASILQITKLDLDWIYK